MPARENFYLRRRPKSTPRPAPTAAPKAKKNRSTAHEQLMSGGIVPVLCTVDIYDPPCMKLAGKDVIEKVTEPGWFLLSTQVTDGTVIQEPSQVRLAYAETSHLYPNNFIKSAQSRLEAFAAQRQGAPITHEQLHALALQIAGDDPAVSAMNIRCQNTHITITLRAAGLAQVARGTWALIDKLC